MKKKAILLASYNGEKYITELLASLFYQTDSDFVIYVHDDGSIDGTMEIVKEFREAHPEKLVVLDGPATGSAKANFLWMLSKVDADYYYLCDQDDVWCEHKVLEEYEEMLALESEAGDGEPCLVFSDMYVVDDKLEMLSDSFIRYIGREPFNTDYTQVLIDNPAAGCTMCLNRAMRDIVIGAANEVVVDNIPMHDSFILILADLFGVISVLDMPLVQYRQTGMNTMGASTETEADKLARNMEMATSGGFIARKKAFIMEARNFAMEILRIKELPEKDRALLEEFVNLEDKGKLARMRFYRKNNFTRAHHNFWMRLFV